MVIKLDIDMEDMRSFGEDILTDFRMDGEDRSNRTVHGYWMHKMIRQELKKFRKEQLK